MNGEPDNSLRETDNADPISETDNLESLDFYDPEEDNVEPETEVRTDDETQEAEAEVQEVPEVEAEADPTEEESEQTTEAKLDALVTLDDGTQKSVQDLIAGNMMQADYTRGKQDIANRREAVEAESQRIQGISEALVEHLTTMVPSEPDPQLALTNPNAYTAQRAQYDAAMATVQKLIETGSQAKESVSTLSEADHKARITEENRMLAMALPQTATADGRKEFFSDVASVAEKIGFSREDAQSIDDHRIFLMAHWAKKGMDAEAARTTAQEKVKAAPTASVRKPGQAARQANKNEAAMRKLEKTGSLADALAVDFE